MNYNDIKENIQSREILDLIDRMDGKIRDINSKSHDIDQKIRECEDHAEQWLGKSKEYRLRSENMELEMILINQTIDELKDLITKGY